MRWIDAYLDFIAAVLIGVLLVLRDNGVIELTADTLLYLGVGGAGIRGFWEMRKRNAIQKRIAAQQAAPSTLQPDDTTPKNGAA